MPTPRLTWVVLAACLAVVVSVAVPTVALNGSMFHHGGLSTAGTDNHDEPPTNGTAGYAVTFSETGLPAGTHWRVGLCQAILDPPGEASVTGAAGPSWGDCPSNSTNTSTVGFSLGNGTYSFVVSACTGDNGTYVATPQNGTFSINGSGQNFSVTFAPITFYSVTFVEHGLPNGTFWFVAASSPFGSEETPAALAPFWDQNGNGSNTSSVGFSLPNGTYNFSVFNVSNGSTAYTPSPRNGTLVVAGSSLTVDIAFAPVVEYSITFVESGLPDGTFWSVSLFGQGQGAGGGNDSQFAPACGSFSWNGSTNASITFEVPNGTYGFEVGNVSNGSGLYVAAPSNGSVTVNGTDAVVSVTFSTVPQFAVSFVASGVAVSAWAVTLWSSSNGWFENETNGSSVGFVVPDGSYAFSVYVLANDSAGQIVATPANGTVDVNGSSVTVAIHFGLLQLYTVTFSESGLPNGTFWSVELFGGAGQNFTPFGPVPGCGFFFWNGSTNASIAFALPNGTFNFSVGNVSLGSSEYVPSPANGSVVVSGADVSVTIVFATVPLYGLTFNETGLPNGTAWGVLLNASGEWFWTGNFSNTTSIGFELTNGTYNFTVLTPECAGNFTGGGYVPSPETGTVTISGSSVVVAITFLATPA